MFSATFRKTPKLKADTAILTAGEGGLSDAARARDGASDGLIAQVVEGQKAFSGRIGQTLALTASGGGPRRIVLLGTAGAEGAAAWETAGGKLMAAVRSCGARAAVLHAEGMTGPEAAAVAYGMLLRAYSFRKYKADPEKPEDVPVVLEKLEIVTPHAAAAAKTFERLGAVAGGVVMARDLVNEPPNALYPESFASRVKAELEPLGVEVDILDEKRLAKLGFGAHLAVGMGSARPPRLVVLRWKGLKGRGKARPLAFVGKGVTFDTGGISIKPAANMDEMKMDMGGAAAVTGLIRTLAARKAKIDAVGILALAENMPSGSAYRPGDILRSLSGKTIEVLNTDAEGRLVLCDALTYVQRTYNPHLIVDLATLTGAIMVALGHEYAGVFANRDEIWTQLEAASKASGEKLWRMPLDEAYRKEMESAVADLKNLGSLGRYGGACSAAGFLEHFIDRDRAWVHIDIAGTAWINADKPLVPKHATGFGVRVLDRFVADFYET